MSLDRQKDYSDANLTEILRRADDLLGKTIQELLLTEGSDWSPYSSLSKLRETKKFFEGTGHVGNAVEEMIFGITNNSSKDPDFSTERVELKVTGMKKLKQKSPTGRGNKGDLIAKERFTFGMINYEEIVNEKWENSSLLSKNARLLVLFYLYEERLHAFDYRFLNQKLFFSFLEDLSEHFVAQVKADWEYIVSQIKSGRAHQLSSSQTSYLEASSKGASGQLKKQPFSQIKAKPRALSLKDKAVDVLFKMATRGNKPIPGLVRGKQTIEDFIQQKLDPILGMSGEAIAKQQGFGFNHDYKSRWRQVIERQLTDGKKFKMLVELPASFTVLRVVNFEKDMKLKEHISFPAFDYFRVAEDTWEESDFYELLSEQRFLFAMFRKDGEDDNGHVISNFIGWKFWSFPIDLLSEAQKTYEETQSRIRDSNYKFPTARDSNYCHVRPHDSKALYNSPAPDGTLQKKYCFWLNREFIASALIGEISNESN